MALLINETNLTNIKLVSFRDDAIADDFNEEDYAEYLKSGADESKLKLKPDAVPTYLVLNFAFKGSQGQKVKNAMMSGQTDEGKPTLSYGSWQFSLTKMALKDVINPPNVPVHHCLNLKRDNGGALDDVTMGLLERMGVIQEIFVLYTEMTKKEKSEIKNS